MNAQPKVIRFSCPCCGGDIGEASSLQDVRASITRPSLRLIFDMLAERPGREVMRDTIMDRLYSHRPDGGPDRGDHVVKVFVSQLRRQIERHGWTITQSRGGSGYLAQWRLIPTEAGA